MIVRPGEVTHRVTRYSDPEQTLIASDWDLLTGQSLPTESGERCAFFSAHGKDRHAALPFLSTEGSSRAVVVSFSLPKSSYGTVAMREMVRNVRIKK